MQSCGRLLAMIVALRFINDLGIPIGNLMLNLILSVVLAVFLGICFKVWPRFGVRVLPGIMHNYIACVVSAYVVAGQWPLTTSLLSEPWIFLALGLSLCFIAGFYLFGVSISVWGMATMSAVQKMSLVISALFAILIYREAATLAKMGGILFGMAAIPMLLVRSGKNAEEVVDRKAGSHGQALALVAGTFLLAGAIEIGLLIAESGMVSTTGDPRFIAVIFSGAFVFGGVVMFRSKIDRQAFFSWKHVFAGWILGIPNFFSIYFLMRAIGSGLDASIVFPVNNTATIFLATLLGVLIFRESFTWKNGIGIVLAVLSLTLLTVQV